MTDTSGFRRMPFRPARRGIALTRWRIENFKSVRDAEVELRPLTVLVGANSSGKSTLLQSIRAASQAVGAGGDALYPLNGRSVRLGTVAEVKYRGPLSEDEQMDIAVQVDEQVPVNNEKAPTEQERRRRQELREALREQIRREHQLVLGADFEFRPPAAIDHLRRPGKARSAAHTTLSWNLKLGPSSQQLGIARINQLDVRLTPGEVGVKSEETTDRSWLLAFADAAAEETSVNEHDGFDPSPGSFTGQFSGRTPDLLDLVGIRVAGGFPLQASVMRPRADVLFETWLSLVLRTSLHYREDTQRLVQAENPAEALAEYLGGIDASIRVVDDDYVRAVRMELNPRSAGHLGIDLNTAAEPSFGMEVIEALVLLGVAGQVPSLTDLGDLGPASAAASEFLGSSIRYLGPLREEPRAAYPDAPEGDDSYVGPKGEFTASVLQRHRDLKVLVPTPDDDGTIKTPRRPIQLMTAVSRWAKFLDIGESFSVSDQGRFGIQMQVRQADVEGDLDLTSVGTGVSQLLPVIVMCVQAPVGSLLLIEQPELHLNPKVQQRLADFLLVIAQSGRRLIVETHSEYLISRLRRRVAEDEEDSLQDTIGIYFAKRVNGATTYELVQQNEFGGIEEWPVNFFDQATEEEHAILSAAVKKRRAKAAKTD
ncbi:DUF3696 domain-containing protein [Agromyces sp. MMS24-JH15]|uniref:AAA family ATPase n=1 Tax=Agromyces sp. MMS24-JH15 TaxID=3243765 RepID=UPI0037484978